MANSSQWRRQRGLRFPLEPLARPWRNRRRRASPPSSTRLRQFELLVMRLVQQPAPSRTAGSQALVLAVGIILAGALARRWGRRQGTTTARTVAWQQHDELLDLVAHEVKSPLTILSGNAQLLRRHLQVGGVMDPDRLQTVLTMLNETAMAAATQFDTMIADNRQRRPPP